jgi:hypothetical protein
MVVKIFKAAASFKAIGYNFRKLLSGKGELMKVSGFDALKALKEIRAEDYLNYLEAQSALNRNVKLPQFHAMISAPDSSYDKKELTKLAEKWLEAMGYGGQPYLLVFHRDTDQAHIHIVTTRVKRNGEKVDSAFEHKRAVRELNRLMQLDEAHQAQLDAGKALRYACSTRAQVLLLLEGMGHRCQEKDGQVILWKFGRPLFAIGEKRIAERLAAWSPDKGRALQLKAIIRKYQAVYDSSLRQETRNLTGGRAIPAKGYHSDLSDFLQKELGLQFVFHTAEGKPPYGYTIIDHTQKRVFKGSEVMKLSEFLSPGSAKTTLARETPSNDQSDGAQHDGIYLPPLRPYFTNDIDDQQIHGPRRRRQKKARTNTR